MTVVPKRTALLKGETFAFEMTMQPNDYVNNYLAMGFQMDGYEALSDFKFRKKGDEAWTDILKPVIADEGYASISLPYRAAEITWEFTVSVLAETEVETVLLTLGFSGGNGMFAGINEVWDIVELDAPTFSPAAGTVAKNTAVTLSTAEKDAEIRYTTDGTEPTATSAQYTAPLSITTKTTLKAVTVKYGLCSKVTEAVYTLVAMPTFSASGLVERNSTVTLSCETTGATIYYTTDGTEPTSASNEYTAAITVDRPMTIKAIAILDGEQSLVNEAAYVFLRAPEFSLEAGVLEDGRVMQNSELTLTAADGAEILYTTDGTEPTATSTKYTAPIKLERKTTVKAIAVSGEETSLVAEAEYRVVPIKPEFSVKDSIVESGTTVAITAVGDAVIRYSVMGTVSASSPVYKNPIKITSEKTISAAAFLDDEMSEIVKAKYMVKVSCPVFTPTPGAVQAGTKVTIEAGNASIRYT
ncbi:MAG: chitobiase/beta-hexosaminidase C-terminal domain-containing protein, partial [Bacteroidales bacterium]|nr:chitobiase/beta-hexosaminidase C-terminal domain-containing protein [Bacteroidales bacterium]